MSVSYDFEKYHVIYVKNEDKSIEISFTFVSSQNSNKIVIG